MVSVASQLVLGSALPSQADCHTYLVYNFGICAYLEFVYVSGNPNSVTHSCAASLYWMGHTLPTTTTAATSPFPPPYILYYIPCKHSTSILKECYLCVARSSPFLSPPSSLALLSEALVPFQAVKKEVRVFSPRRKEIKRGIKELAKIVSTVLMRTDSHWPAVRKYICTLFCYTQCGALTSWAF